MTNFLTRRKPFLPALLLASASLFSWSGEGHDHGEAPAAAGGPAKPRFTATSEAALRWVGELQAIGPCELVVGYVEWPPEQRVRLALRVLVNA